jgi:predicted RNase H-like HicB family nuclease
MIYRVILIESDEGFAVFCPAIPGCCSQGGTEAEALEMIADAITELLDVGSIPAEDGGAAREAEIMREADEDRAKVMVREVWFPVAA